MAKESELRLQKEGGGRKIKDKRKVRNQRTGLRAARSAKFRHVHSRIDKKLAGKEVRKYRRI